MFTHARSGAILSVIVALLALPFAAASAASQYHLSYIKDVSACFMACHQEFVDTVNLPNRTTNQAEYITLNCKFDQWQNLVSLCLAETCESAPDAAYAVEYAHDFCKRAGVDHTLQLPEEYVQAASSYFTSTAYTSRGTRRITGWGFGGILALALIGLAVL